MITENLSTLKIHKLTQEQYDRELASGNIDENALYLTPDVVTDVDELIDMMNEYKEETNMALSGKSDTTHTHDNYEEVGVAATKANEALESAKSYTDQEIADLVNAAPETLDTLGELAAAMKENQDVVDVLNNAITLKANKEEVTNEINSINEEIETLNSKDILEIKEASGKVIAVDDSANSHPAELVLEGETTQFSTTGKNLLPSAINGTFTAHTSFVDVNLPSGTYTLSLNISSSGTDNYESLLLLMNESGGSQSFNISRGSTLSRQTLTFTVTSNITQIRILAERSYDNSNGDTLVIAEAQIEEGTIATEYEPYTGGIASPNPDYPQDLESTGDSGSFEVGVYGKNLLDVPQTITVTSSDFAFENQKICLKANHTYTISLINEASVDIVTQAQLEDKNGNYNVDFFWRLSSSGRSQYTFTPTSDIYTIHFYYDGVGTIYNFMLEEGTTATPYEPYTKQTLTIPHTLRSARYDTGSLVRDEIDLTKGINTEKTVKYTFNGSESWGVHHNGFILFNPQYITIYPHYCWCDKYPQVWWNNLASCDYGIFASDGYSSFICVKDKDCSTVEEFKSKLASNPITVIAIRATPIETPLTEQELNAYRQLMMNKPNTTLISEANMELKYVVDSNTAEYLDRRFEEVENQNTFSTIGIDGAEFSANNPSDKINFYAGEGLEATVMSPPVAPGEEPLPVNVTLSVKEDKEVVDSDMSYTKIVPENSGKYASVDKVGGMSYKCKNLIPYPYYDTTKTENGITFTVNSDGTITANGTATATAFFRLALNLYLPEGHYYISDGVNRADAYCRFNVTLLNQNFWWGVGSADVELRIGAGATLNNVVFKPQIERGILATSYEPYYGGLRNAYVTEIKSYSKNLFDIGTDKSGYFTTHYNGSYISTSIGTVSTNIDISFSDNSIVLNNYIITGYLWLSKFIDLAPNTDYTISAISNFGGARIYGANTNTISTTGTQICLFYSDAQAITFNSGNYKYYWISFYPGEAGAKLENCQIEIGTEATEYEPYKAIEPFTIPTGAKGVGYGMGINEDCYNYIDFERGVYVQNCVKVNMSTLNWLKQPKCFEAYPTPQAKTWENNKNAPILCTHYQVDSANNTWQGLINKTISLNNHGYIHIVDKDYTDVATFKESLTDSWLIYPLATPIETDISDLLKGNSIEVQSGGIVTLVNEYNYDVPSEISFYTSENPKKVIVADKFVGDFVGVKTKEIYTPYGSYKPYYSAGDSININTAVAGLITNNKQEVWFTISLPKPIIGNPTITVTSITGLIVRQADKFCYTTSGSLTYVKPNSYNTDLINKNISSLYIGAVMGNTTNVTTDDDACWVNANIRVTFS